MHFKNKSHLLSYLRSTVSTLSVTSSASAPLPSSVLARLQGWRQLLASKVPAAPHHNPAPATTVSKALCYILFQTPAAVLGPPAMVCLFPLTLPSPSTTSQCTFDPLLGFLRRALSPLSCWAREKSMFGQDPWRQGLILISS